MTNAINFDEYVSRWWPASVPADCTNMQPVGDSRDVVDCLERGVHDDDLCMSCKTYAQLSNKFVRLGRA